jgi:hypothetical protein
MTPHSPVELEVEAMRQRVRALLDAPLSTSTQLALGVALQALERARAHLAVERLSTNGGAFGLRK